MFAVVSILPGTAGGQTVAAPAASAQRTAVDALALLTTPPAMRDAGEFPSTAAQKAVYFDALPWKGQPTKVFAWLGMPVERTGKVPGVVLVHGGGGTAFKEWVAKWNEQGFAAISIAVEGQTDVRDAGGAWKPHAWPGPKRVGIYGDSAEPLEDQWIYHAVADTVLANSLLRSLPEVDADRVGVMGISWGGVITSTVMGIDERFAFAIPTYGCGSLSTAGNQYGRALGRNALYKQVWDPVLRMKRATMPALWFSWPEDTHFPLDAHAACYRAAPGPRMVSLIPGMGHGHGPPWNKPDSYAFAESVVKDGKPWCRETKSALNDGVFEVSFAASKPLEAAALVSTTSSGVTGERKWTVTPAVIRKSGDDAWSVAAPLPEATTAWFVNVKSGALTASSGFQETTPANPASARQSPARYPGFTWDKVPVAFHFGKSEALMTDAEAAFVAEHSNFICLEKGHAARQFGNTETGIAKEAQRLKKLNPDMKVIFYWNTFLDYPMYEAHEEYAKHPEWWLKKKDGGLDLKQNRLRRYDLSNAAVRNWWTDVAREAVGKGGADGVFMDAFPQVTSRGNVALWGEEKYQAIQQGLKDIIRETRRKIGDDKLIVYNGIRSTPAWAAGYDFPEHTDAAMIEHFGQFQSTSKECMLKDIREMERACKSGKIVVFKGWAGFTFTDREAMRKPLAEKRRIARESIQFPLAAFLVGAQENSYFIYNWGYRMENGCLEWYPEFDKPLGEPAGDMVREGWTLRREFKHASVWVNLETREADIKWR